VVLLFPGYLKRLPPVAIISRRSSPTRCTQDSTVAVLMQAVPGDAAGLDGPYRCGDRERDAVARRVYRRTARIPMLEA